MSVIYSEAWYADMKELINGSEELRKIAPPNRIVLCLEVEGDGKSPYVPADGAFYHQLEIEAGRVEAFRPLPERFSGKGLDFRFTAPASVWESVAAGDTDPITAGLRGVIKVRGDMRFPDGERRRGEALDRSLREPGRYRVAAGQATVLSPRAFPPCRGRDRRRGRSPVSRLP